MSHLYNRRLGLGVALVASLVSSAPVWAADVLGHYEVKGKSPSGSEYSGSVDVTKTGVSTYEVVWVIGSKKSTGTGVGSGNFIAAAYTNKDSFGVSAYAGQEDGSVVGVWTNAGGKTVGSEIWTRTGVQKTATAPPKILAQATAPASAHISEGGMFPENSDNAPPVNLTEFPTDVKKIVFAGRMQNAKPGAVYKVTWISEKTTGAPENFEIATVDVAVPPDGRGVIESNLSKPDAGWPVGTYRVDVSYDGAPPEYQQRFTVK